MARLILDIGAGLLRDLKQRAAERRITLQALVSELLRQAVDVTPAPKYRFEIKGWNGVLNPEVDICDRNSLARAMEDL